MMTKFLTSLALVATLADGAGQLAAQAAADPQTAQRRARQSWTANSRDYAIGDIVTVVVDEYTLASANRGDFASDRRSRELAGSASQSVVQGVPGGTAGVETYNDAESRQRGEATRQNRFQGELTTRVVEVGPGGMLKIQGRKVIQVDDHQEELALTGWVRPQDIGSANMIDSWRIADAEMVYSSDESLTRPRGGFLGRMLSRIWP